LVYSAVRAGDTHFANDWEDGNLGSEAVTRIAYFDVISNVKNKSAKLKSRN